MFFAYIKMVKCNRTSLNGKDTVIIKPTTKTQMVLGTNSSGKSSLLDIAFSPLPPEKNDFDSGGSLDQVIVHKGRTYELKSSFGDKNSYSFIVDGGENLNKGRNITMQLELVKEHFGYTKELHQFLTGRVNFTSMTPAARQYWISRFSSVDFTYAYQLLKNFQAQLTAHKPIADYLSKQLNETRLKLMPEEDVAKMRAQADELHETLELLLREPKHNETALSDWELEQLITKTLDELAAFVMTEYPTTENVSDLDGLVALRSEAEATLYQLQGELKARGERLSECEQKKARLEALGEYSPEELQASMDATWAMLESIPPQVSEVHPSLLKDHHRPINELRQVLGRLPSVRKSNQDVLEVNNILLDKKMTLGRYVHVIGDLDRQIQHIHKCEVVSCPACKTQFKPGIEPGKLEELESRRQKGEVLVNELTAAVDVVEDELQSTANIAAIYEELDEIRAKYQNSCPGLFQYLDTFGWTKLGRGLTEKVAIFAKDCERQATRDEKQRQYDTLKSRLDLVKAESGQTVQVIEDYKVALDSYNEIHRIYSTAKERKLKLDKALTSWSSYIDLYERAEEHYEKIRKEIIGYCNHHGDVMIDELIKKTKIDIGIHEAALSENETYLNAVKDLEIQVKKARVEEEARRVLVDAMSPKTGLIAEQISLQMSSIIGGVNKMIKRVWSFPLHIFPGEPGDTEMDYKLPMMVENRQRHDISVGSSSVKDIINQAFRLTGYYCMNLTDYPLFLDEIGSTFDEAHRYNLIPFLKELVDDVRFSQVLIISHQLDGQTSFPNSQTIILDDRNLNYPHAYNQHVEFA